MIIRKILFVLVLSLFQFTFINLSPVYAQEVNPNSPPQAETLEAKIISVLDEKEIETMGNKQLYQKLELLVTKGSLKDKKIVVENGNIAVANVVKYKKGESVILTSTKDFEGKDLFYITDSVRRGTLLVLFIAFVVISALIAGFKGLSSLLGMGVSFGVIFAFILPQISGGADPVFVAILGSVVIIPVTFYLSHGFNKKTSIAIFGTFLALIFTGVLASIFIEAAKLTGFVSEEAGFLQGLKPGVINIKGLLLAGTIIGALGVLDDITVAQAGVVSQLKEAVKDISFIDLYKRAMKVGQDHIASMVNTLILVYTGASLPLLLLFIDNPRPFSEVINYEIVADEIVRTLVGSIGLIMAVPITTFLASVFLAPKSMEKFLKEENKIRNDKRYFKSSKPVS